MTQTETIAKPLKLTAEQQAQITKIQNDMVADIQGNIKVTIKTACELIDALRIVPTQKISYFICQCAEQLGYSEDYLRTLIPAEYKDKFQRLAALSKHSTHAGIDNLSQHETTPTVEIDDDDQIAVGEAAIQSRSQLSSAQKYSMKEFEALKTEFDKVTAENTELKKKLENVFDIHALVYFAEGEESDEELGKKVRIAVRDDPRYKAYFKKKNKSKARTNKKIGKVSF